MTLGDRRDRQCASLLVITLLLAGGAFGNASALSVNSAPTSGDEMDSGVNAAMTADSDASEYIALPGAACAEHARHCLPPPPPISCDVGGQSCGSSTPVVKFCDVFNCDSIRSAERPVEEDGVTTDVSVPVSDGGGAIT